MLLNFLRASLVLFALSSSAFAAETLPDPSGDIVLTVTGAPNSTATTGPVAFDANMLKSLGAVTFRTTTIWTEGEHAFTGVPLHVLLEQLGVSTGTIKATAINDYSVAIPVTDAVPSGPIVAYEMDGKPMSRREKGPLWIVYPYDASPDCRTEVIYSRSIWQLDRLEIVE